MFFILHVTNFVIIKIHNIVEWMDSAAETLPEKRMGEGCNVWSGKDFLPYFNEMGLSCQTHIMIMVTVVFFKS